jgi:serine protease AprX
MNKKVFFALTLIFAFSLASNAKEKKVQNEPLAKNVYYHYLIEFYDKANSPFSIQNPDDFLGPKAIERRKRLNIPLTEADLPVNPSYVEAIQAIDGVQIKHISKWFNFVSAAIDTEKVKTEDLLRIPFVKSVKYIGKTPHSIIKESQSDTSKNIISTARANEILISRLMETAPKNLTYNSKYGAAFPQIQMLSGHKLHNAGFTGKGVLIAVLDAGFENVNKIAAFNHLFEQNRIVAWRDFVDFDNSVWEDDEHGTNVLSCIAGHVEGQMLGTAPDASFLLIRTENAASETRIEEISWIAGAEFADSMGADIISSSLGYTSFDEKEFSFSYNMLDGRTTLITRAADIAFDKGILVMNSAGNEGNSAWQYIGAPADGIKVVASGGVNYNMQRSDFSSKGPSADGRIKPNISAIATNTIVVNSKGDVIPSNGTSFSNPVLSGMMACLLQAAQNKSLEEVLRAVYSSASHAANGNRDYGWGVPNFEMALAMLGYSQNFNPSQNYLWVDDYKTHYAGLTIRYYAAKKQKLKLRFSAENNKGKFKRVSKTNVRLKKGQFFSTPWLIELIDLNKNVLESGNYRFILKGKRLKHTRNFSIEANQSEDEIEYEYQPD